MNVSSDYSVLIHKTSEVQKALHRKVRGTDLAQAVAILDERILKAEREGFEGPKTEEVEEAQ